MPEPVRHFTDRYGVSYTVRIVPMERSGGLGVDRRLNALVFEVDGRWVGSAPIYHTVSMDSLTDVDLEQLREQAT